MAQTQVLAVMPSEHKVHFGACPHPPPLYLLAKGWVQFSRGILGAPGKSTSPNFAPSFPPFLLASATYAAPGTSKPHQYMPWGGYKAAPEPGWETSLNFLPLNACSCGSSGHIGGTGVVFLLMRVRRNLLIKEKKKKKKLFVFRTSSGLYFSHCCPVESRR